jgi:UDP-3-O-[3-hydroxymyristoyl] glucosamine N-acyltransferase
MSDPVFFRRARDLAIGDVVTLTGASVDSSVNLGQRIDSVAPLDAARPGALVFLDNPKYADDLVATRASACLVQARYRHLVPVHTAALVCREPYSAFAIVLGQLFPSALRPSTILPQEGMSAAAHVHQDARLEAGVLVDPGVVIGPGAEIGSGTWLAANATIGPDVRIGRQCSIGPNTSILNALIGDRVIIHPGVRIGQDGFGFAMAPGGHRKVPQIGRVIIQDDVEIGANSTIDRGANRDTCIGQGTKIDNLVQIGHNVVIGRHCVIVSQVGISGSCTIDDFVVIAGQAGLVGHLHVGQAAQIGAASGVMRDVAAGEKVAGAPAQPVKDWLRGIALLRKLAARQEKAKDDAG